MNIFNFTPAYNITFGIFTCFLAFLVAFRANSIYSRTNDKRMLIIAAGFILGGIFEILHFMNSHTKGVQFFYIFFENLCYSGSIFISLFFSKDISSTNNDFKNKTLIISLTFFSLVILLRYILAIETLEKIIPYASIEIIFTALYFLLAALIFDIRSSYNLRPISPVVIGLILLSLSEIYIITPAYFTSIYRFIIHIENLIALYLIFQGINDLLLKSEPLNSRQGLIIFSSLILLSSYWIIILGGLIIFQINFSTNLKYYFLIFFIITVIIQYILSKRVVNVITKPLKSIRTTFIITTLLIITIILILQSFISLHIFKTYTEHETKAYLQCLIENETSKFYSKIRDVEITNQINAASIKSFDKTSLDPIIRNNFRFNPLIFGSGVLLEPNIYRPGVKYYSPYWFRDEKGNIKFTQVYNVSEFDYFKQDWYKNGFIPNAQAVWSEPYRDEVLDIDMMTATSPIRRQNKIVGVIITDIKLDTFQNYISNLNVGHSGYAFIVSDKGYYISYRNNKKILKDKITEDKDPYIRQIGKKIIKANKTGIVRANIDNKDSFIIYAPIVDTKLKMIFVLPLSEVYFNLNRTLTSNIILFFLAIILFSIVFTTLFSRTIANPLDNLIKTIDKVAKGDLSARSSIKSKNEIGLFADSLNYMIGSLESLINKEKQTSEREALLRKIVETIRSSLDINEVLIIICDEVAKVFNVQRATIAEFPNKQNYNDYIIRREYKVYPDIKGVSDIEYDSKAAAYWAKKTLDEEMILVIDNIYDSDTPDYFKKSYEMLGIKSMLGSPIKRESDKWGTIVLSEYNYFRHWTEEEINFLGTIADQIYIAIKQAELYSITKKQAEREKVLRETISTIRSTLDINQIKQTFVTQAGKVLDADRTFIMEYDPNTNKFSLADKYSEYRASTNVKSIIGEDFNQEKIQFMIDINFRQKEIVFSDVDEYIKENNLQNTTVENYFKEYSIKSNIGVPIVYAEHLYGLFVVHYTEKKVAITADDIEFVKTLTNQAGIAIYQSRLYESVKQNAEKEKLLRNIISDLKIFQNFEQAYNYTLEKMAEIFDVGRTIFIEIPEYKSKKPSIKYEYIRNKTLTPIIGKHMPETCQQMFIDMADELKTIAINDTKEHFTDVEETQKFFQDNQIKSFIATPFVKYNKEVRVFGILVVCSDKTKIWSNKEIDLLKSVSESVITVLWEILRFNEINELRDTFILTLAHDLQVPLVGERKALEFLESRPVEQPIGKFKEFIIETLKSNQNLFNLLTRLLESYYYESGKKSLNLDESSIRVTINQVVDKLKWFADSKSMKIDIDIEKNLPKTTFDKDAIQKAIYYLLENAISYTQEGGDIVIKSSKQNNSIITCVCDNGPGIEPEIQERIFKRYEMARAIERKIGAGLSLYLVKQIVEAHKGRIWYETKPNKGTTFCFLLPIT